MTAADIASLLRLEVGRLRARESHGRFDSVLHVGALGGQHVTCAVSRDDADVLDAGTRTEIVTRLLEEHPGPDERACVWLTRPGEPVVQDDDLAWLSAASRAFGSFDRGLVAFWTVTRTGWLDLRTGDSRTWKRLRI